MIARSRFDGRQDPQGHVRVEERTKGRRIWIVEYTLPGQSRTTKVLGQAWVRPSGKTTPRGAPIWRAGHGSKPDDRYLTPAEAQAKLKELLEAPQKSKKPSAPRKARGMTFGEAVEDFLHRAEHVQGLEETTLRNYRVAVGKLKQEFPAETPLRKFTAERIDDYQTKLLTTPVTRGQREPKPLARKTVRNRMLVLSGILQRACERDWITADPMAGVTIVPDPGANPDFNVLTPKQVEEVAEKMALVADDELPLMRNDKVDERSLAIMREARAMCAEAVRLAAYTGLRFGELCDLRWRDIDCPGRNLHVRRNTPTSAPKGVMSKRPKGRRGRSLPLIDQALVVLDRLQQAGYPSGPEDFVLPNTAGGMLDSGKVRKAFYRGLRLAGLGARGPRDS